MLEDWQVLNWVMPELWGWAGVPYNPEALTSKAWLAELRAGRYRGRPRTATALRGGRPGGPLGGVRGRGWCVTRTDSGEWSWNG